MLLVATCFVILKLIATVGAQNPRSVHVALETALTFNNKDNAANVKFLDEVQNFISKVRNTVVKKDTRRSNGKPNLLSKIINATSKRTLQKLHRSLDKMSISFDTPNIKVGTSGKMNPAKTSKGIDTKTNSRNTFISSGKEGREKKNFIYDDSLEIYQRSSKIYASNLKFTEFIIELIDILKAYKNDDLEDVFAVIDDEIRKYHYKGCKFYELVSNENMRRLVATNLGYIREKPAKSIRKTLVDSLQYIEDAKLDSKKLKLMDYINSLYTKSDVQKFQKALGYFHIYRSKTKRANMDLILLVRDTLRNLVFDHYSNLNMNTRRDFKAKLETYFWSHLKGKDSVQLEWTVQYQKSTESNRDLRQNTRKYVTKEKDISKENMAFTSTSKLDKPIDTINLDLRLDNQMDIIKSGEINMHKNNNRRPERNRPVTTNDTSTNKQIHMVTESTERVDSDSDDYSATASEDDDKSDDVNGNVSVGNADSDQSADTVASAESNEAEWTTKGRQNKRLRYTTSLPMDYSAEVVKHRNVKGFTNGNIGRSDNEKPSTELSEDSDEFTRKPRTKKHRQEKTKTYGMHTLWVESRITTQHQDWWDDEIANNRGNDGIYVKATQMPGDFRSHLHHKKEKHRESKQPKIKIQHTPKARYSVISKEKYRSKIKFEVKKKNKQPNKEKDFNVDARLEHENTDDDRKLKFKLSHQEISDDDKQSFRTKDETNNDKSEIPKNDESFSEKKMIKASYAIGEQDKISEENVLNEFTKVHKPKKNTSKPISRSKQHKIVDESTEEETYNASKEDTKGTIKLPKKEDTLKFQPHASQEELWEDITSVFTKKNTISVKSTKKPITKNKKHKNVETSSKEGTDTTISTTISTKSKNKSKLRPRPSKKESVEEIVSTELTKRHKTVKKSDKRPISKSKQLRTGEKFIEKDTSDKSKENTSQTKRKPSKKVKKVRILSHPIIEGAAMEEEVSIEIDKQHKKQVSKSPILRSERKPNENPSKEETSGEFSEESKLFKARPYTVLGKQESEEKENNYLSETDTQTTIVETEIPKKAERSGDRPKEDNSSESLESMSTTKKDKELHKRTTKQSSRHVMDLSMEQIKTSDENKTMKKKHKKKHHTPKEKISERSLEELYAKEVGKENMNENIVSIEDSMEKGTSPINEMKNVGFKSDIFIPIENMVQPTQANKTEKKSKKRVKAENFLPESTSIAEITDELYTKNPKIHKKPKQSEEAASQNKVINTELLMSRLTSTPRTVNTSPNQLTTISSAEMVKPTTTSRPSYKPMDIPVKADKTGILSHKLFLRKHGSAIKSSSTSVNKSTYRRMNSEDDLTKSTRPFLQLIDLLENRSTMTINLNAMTQPSTIDVEGINQNELKHDLSDFRKRPTNKVKMKTAVSIDTTTSLTTTTTVESTTTKNLDTTATVRTIQNDDEKPRKARKKKTKRRKTTTIKITNPMTTNPVSTTILTTTNTIPTTTVVTTQPTTATIKSTTTEANILTKTTEYRRSNNKADIFNKQNVETENKNAETTLLDNKIDDYYNDDNVTVLSINSTTADIDNDIKEILDKFDIKMDGKNDSTLIDERVFNVLINPNEDKDVKKTKPDIKAEIKAEKARMKLNEDMMKVYGKTYSHYTQLTTPWNTLFTDPFEGNDNLLGIDLIGLNI